MSVRQALLSLVGDVSGESVNFDPDGFACAKGAGTGVGH